MDKRDSSCIALEGRILATVIGHPVALLHASPYVSLRFFTRCTKFLIRLLPIHSWKSVLDQRQELFPVQGLERDIFRPNSPGRVRWPGEYSLSLRPGGAQRRQLRIVNCRGRACCRRFSVTQVMELLECPFQIPGTFNIFWLRLGQHLSDRKC
jgi:hypothetical protein